MNSPQAQPHAYGEDGMMWVVIRLNPTYTGERFPNKALHLQGARKSFTFPVG